jgi:hypothetical protein
MNMNTELAGSFFPRHCCLERYLKFFDMGYDDAIKRLSPRPPKDSFGRAGYLDGYFSIVKSRCLH